MLRIDIAEVVCTILPILIIKIWPKDLSQFDLTFSPRHEAVGPCYATRSAQNLQLSV
jgi:hypothetical protein